MQRQRFCLLFLLIVRFSFGIISRPTQIRIGEKTRATKRMNEKKHTYTQVSTALDWFDAYTLKAYKQNVAKPIQSFKCETNESFCNSGCYRRLDFTSSTKESTMNRNTEREKQSPSETKTHSFNYVLLTHSTLFTLHFKLHCLF